MANDLNRVFLIGRLTRDSEMRYTASGTAICRFSLAVNRYKRSGDGGSEEVSFFDCVLFGTRAEKLTQYLGKGKQVGIDGSLRQNRWEKDGQARSKVEILVDDLQLLGGRGGNEGGGSGNGGGGNSGGFRGGGFKPEGAKEPGFSDDFEDDIPF